MPIYRNVELSIAKLRRGPDGGACDLCDVHCGAREEGTVVDEAVRVIELPSLGRGRTSIRVGSVVRRVQQRIWASRVVSIARRGRARDSPTRSSSWKDKSCSRDAGALAMSCAHPEASPSAESSENASMSSWIAEARPMLDGRASAAARRARLET